MDCPQHLRAELAPGPLAGIVVGLGMIQMNLVEALRLAALKNKLRGVSPRELTISEPTLARSQAPELHCRRHKFDSQVIDVGASEGRRDKPSPVAAAKVDHSRRLPAKGEIPGEAFSPIAELRAGASPQFSRQHPARERGAFGRIGSERAGVAAKGSHAPTVGACMGLAGAHGNRTHPACARHATAALKAVPDTSPDPLPRDSAGRPEATPFGADGEYPAGAVFERSAAPTSRRRALGLTAGATESASSNSSGPVRARDRSSRPPRGRPTPSASVVPSTFRGSHRRLEACRRGRRAT